MLAHRTSPTNIGLYLLATVSARDFGWSGTIAAVGRLEATLATTALGIAHGVDMVRVHDVAANVRAARMSDAIVRGTWQEGSTP